jgi:hypothetical protein
VAVFPLARELIILLAAWALLLPAGIGRGPALLVLFLLLESLMVVRLAGADPLAPRYLGLVLAGIQAPGSVDPLAIASAEECRRGLRSVKGHWFL